MIITIDGPTASGKSTIARMLAQDLNYYYLCSGLLYRSLAYLLVHTYKYTEETINSIDPVHIAACFNPDNFLYTYDTANQERIFFNENEITPYLKDSFIDRITSITSTNEYVRHFVTLLQHKLANDHDIVIDGRDVGSAVFPRAEYKFFLTASVEVRAKRWLTDQNKRNNHFTEKQAIEKITDRDKRDIQRSIAPLIIPENAIVIDNSTMNLQETFTTMRAYIKN